MNRSDFSYKLCKMAEKDCLGPDEIQVLCDATCGGIMGSGLDRSKNLGKWYKVVQCMVTGRRPYVLLSPDEYFLSRVERWFECHTEEQ